MDSSVSPKDETWFLRVCHHISKAVYLVVFVEFPQVNFAIKPPNGSTEPPPNLCLLKNEYLCVTYRAIQSERWRLRWSSGLLAGLWFPSSRVQTRPKPLDFFCVKKSSAHLPSEGKLNNTGQHTNCICNQNSWVLFNSMCWIQICP
jgi:hypothetical protein